MTQITVNLAEVKVSGKITEKTGDRAWKGAALDYNISVDLSNLTEEKLLELAMANWKVRFHAWLKPKGEQAVRDFFANISQPVDAMDCLSEGGGGFVGKFQKCEAAVAGLRNVPKITNEKIVEYLKESYGEENVRQVIAGNNPWKVAAKPKAEPKPGNGKVVQLDENEKKIVIDTAKAIFSTRDESQTNEQLIAAVVKMVGLSDAKRGIVETFAKQIIK